MKSSYSKDMAKEFSNYSITVGLQDVMAGLTVAAVALPLALAFGVGSGANAPSGLITAILAGLLIGSLGGGSFQISGPTGAMTAILLPLSATYGIEGVLTAGMLSGVLLLLASIAKMGRIVSVIPSAVITGFTSGIAILIATSQIDPLMGTTSVGHSMIEKFLSYQRLGFDPQWNSILIGLTVIICMVIWPKTWNAKIPSSLIGITVAIILQLVFDLAVAEVGNIPKTLILEKRLRFSLLSIDHISEVFMPAVSIAALGMIESLLCGATASKMKKEGFNADRELLAQGIGNIIIPFFGGVPATAAIARTSVAIKSGGKTRLTSIVHALVLIASMFLLGPIMSHIPLSALAGVLIVTAWRMNEWQAIRTMCSRKYKTSIAQFVVTMIATVLLDLTLAIALGLVLSMILFVIKSSYLDITVDHIDNSHQKGKNLAPGVTGIALMYVSGTLFFGSQEQFMSKIRKLMEEKIIIISMRGVPYIDQSAMTALEEIWEECERKGIHILFCALQPPVKALFLRSHFLEKIEKEHVFEHAVEAIDYVSQQNF